MGTTIIHGTKAAAKGEYIEVLIDDVVVENLASQLALALVMSNETVTSILGMADAKECFVYALEDILIQNSGALPSFETVPNFLSDIVMSLSMVYRGVRIHVKPLKRRTRPNLYGLFLDVLNSLGIPTGRILKVDVNDTTNVLKVGTGVNENGAVTLTGIDGDFSLEELVVRSMLDVPKKEAEKLSRIVGHMEYVYAPRDEVLRQWALSLPIGKR